MKKQKLQLTYRFNKTGKLLLFGSLFLMVMLFNLKSIPDVWSQIPLVSERWFTNHLSNFGLSFMFMLAMCLSLLSYTRATWKFIAAGAVSMVTLNFIAELFVTVANTKDIIDAWAGLMGVLAGLAVIVLVWRFGLTNATR